MEGEESRRQSRRGMGIMDRQGREDGMESELGIGVDSVNNQVGGVDRDSGT